MRSYRQTCALAKALDVIGDRWNLLIVRELLLRGACRYTDLRNGLPGIATNLLADRLRELEQAGVVAREEAPPPIATTLFRLTERGEALDPVVRELGKWGVSLVSEGSDEDVFRGHWLELPTALFLEDHAPERPAIAIAVDTGDEPMVIETVDGAVRARPGAAADPDLVLSGPPKLLLGAISGHLTLDEARARGLRCEGDLKAFERVAPAPAGVATSARRP